MSKAALDYLRLATWDTSEHVFLMSDVLKDGNGQWEHSKWLQYHGWKREQFFLGTGYQKKRRHSVVNISGYMADRNYIGLKSYDSYYATRIDVQVTIPKPAGVDLNAIYNLLQTRKVKSSCIQSESNDTLYIGARTSDVFIRLYEKPLDKMYLRFEFEFKGWVARGIWKALQAETTVDEIFQHYLAKCKIPDRIKKFYFEVQDGETAFAIRQEIAKTDRQKLEWLQSIDASVRQSLYNHNIGVEVASLVRAWAWEASNVDIIEEMN
jgi:hypothetical protein